jgi:hypothetical protein
MVTTALRRKLWAAISTVGTDKACRRAMKPLHSVAQYLGGHKNMTTIRTRILRFAAAGGIIAGAAMAVPVHAFADCSNYGGGKCGAASSVPTPTTKVSAASTSPDSSLPFTGGDVVGLSLIGIGAVAGGTALVRSGRRKAVGA